MQLEPVAADGKLAIGSIACSDEEKTKLASQTMDFNRRNPKFRELFPQLLVIGDESAAASLTGGGEGGPSEP